MKAGSTGRRKEPTVAVALTALTVYGHQFQAGCFDYVNGEEFDQFQAKEQGYADGWAYGRDVFEW